VEVQTVYNVAAEMPLGLPIATYFYMTGLSAGSFVMSAIATVGGVKRFKPIARIGAILAPVLLMLAPINLIIDLTQPLRSWHLFVYLNPTSPITYGSFLLTVYPISGLIYVYFLFSDNTRMAKVFGVIGVPLAVATHGYTGFILALGKRPLWSTALMPTLFIVSAMLSGVALLIFIVTIRHWIFRRNRPKPERAEVEAVVAELGRLMGWLIAADLFLVANDILVLLTSRTEELYVAHMMLAGKFAPLFLGVEVALGGLLPLALVFTPRTSRITAVTMLSSVLVLVGVYAMRVVVVFAGQSVPLH
jgi:tetrathionate reductase subunit C